MIVLDYRDPRPIYEQIVQKLSELILADIFTENEQMPSVRSLATELSINPNTIQRAYAELERRGYIYSVKGRGSFVSGSGPLREKKQEELLTDFRKLAGEAIQAGISKERLAEELQAAADGRADSKKAIKGEESL